MKEERFRWFAPDAVLRSPTCGISPASVQTGSHATLTVNATALTASVATRELERAGTLHATVLLLWSAHLVHTRPINKKKKEILGIVPFDAACHDSACGARAVTPPENYTVTITALSGDRARNNRIADGELNEFQVDRGRPWTSERRIADDR